MKIKDSRILITGGSLGIGKEAARLLVEQGAQVVITGRDSERIQAAAQEIGAIAVTADVAVPEDIQRTYKETLEHLGGLDCLVNNAGIGYRKTLLEITAEDFHKIHSVNVIGATLMAKEAAKIFIDQKTPGNIINISSTASLKGYEGGSVYSSSKFALRGLSECWRAELRKHDIRVITINPSEVTTAFGSSQRIERDEQPQKLRSKEIADVIVSTLEMDDRGFVPEVTIHATNPWKSQ